MSLPSIITFSLAMFVLAATPGPGVFATVASSLSSGFRQTLFLIAGIILGDLFYLLFAIFGLSFIAQTMAEVFTLIRFVGGGYLVYLGIKIWRIAPQCHLPNQPVQTLPGRQQFISGLFITLSNPKVIIFYCGFLPTFINLKDLPYTDIMTIAILVTLILGCILCGYSYAGSRTRRLFSSATAMRYLNRSAGAVMATTGIVIATRS